MRSFKVVPIASLDVPDAGVVYVDACELTCRWCDTSFVLAQEPRVGAEYCCPKCWQGSVIPKRARWTRSEG